MVKEIYNKKFYSEQKDVSLESARIIVPLVLKLIKPRSVVDIGCGLGTWLSVFKENGVDNILGLDGQWVDKDRLLIPKEKFLEINLSKSFNLKQKFDLVVSLEVAEHISKDNSDAFIDSITKLGPVILFSAAIPFQGGVNHINEQWPEYWIKIFEKKGYMVLDPIRKKVWDNEKVEFYYAQNIFLFVSKEYLKKSKILKEEHLKTNKHQLSIVHPKRYLLIAGERNKIGKLIPGPIKKLILKLKYAK